ncbi:type IV pilus modification PilV family protein [Paenibacillus daejeonensis]|uniref:type IV pilus modification PilV family protein n=1 Tax=Paenibacillus daejeonensis TaxID=135193 RepID=UPI0003659D79|nr:type II secretion system protein [Paenibacillus daejeonensis]
MNNQRGVTLIEVLGSVALLAVAILTITYALQQSTVFSKDNEQIDQSVQITRTVMEELRGHLSDPALRTIAIYDQVVDLDQLREGTSSPIKLYYPDTTQVQYTLSISSASGGLPAVGTGDDTMELDSSFKQITIYCESPGKNKPYELQAYLEVD